METTEQVKKVSQAQKVIERLGEAAKDGSYSVADFCSSVKTACGKDIGMETMKSNFKRGEKEGEKCRLDILPKGPICVEDAAIAMRNVINQIKQSKRGGARPGSGQPKKYACETKVVGFRVPIEFEAEIKAEVQKILKGYERVK